MKNPENPIVQIMKEQKITKPGLSRQAGISYGTIYFLSTGLTGTPKHKTFEKLAKFSNKSTEQLKSDWKQYRKSLHYDD